MDDCVGGRRERTCMREEAAAAVAHRTHRTQPTPYAPRTEMFLVAHAACPARGRGRLWVGAWGAKAWGSTAERTKKKAVGGEAKGLDGEQQTATPSHPHRPCPASLPALVGGLPRRRGGGAQRVVGRWMEAKGEGEREAEATSRTQSTAHRQPLAEECEGRMTL